MDFFLSVLFPRFCLRCGREGTVWCKACDVSYRPQGFSCTRFDDPFALDGLLSFTNYGDPIVRSAIRSWKFDGDTAYRDVLFHWLRQGMKKSFWAEEVEAVSWVPLHLFRLRTRGFDQAEELAHEVGRLAQKPVIGLLERNWSTPHQSERTREERHQDDLHGLFRVNETMKLPNSVLLCDDVYTSGATLRASAKALKQAGVKTVWGFVLALGGKGKETL